MKRKILLIVLATTLILSLCACGEKKVAETEDPQTVSEQVDNSDKMVKHIKSIEPEDREEFLAFWQSSILYCKAIALELKNGGNTDKYEFDPTDENQIPKEISSLYDFSELSRENTENLHKDFIMTVDGADVTLSYDGMEIYPTTYAYSDIQDIINSLK